MTREEAIKKHRELWHWIADETRRKHRNVQKAENPDVANEMPLNECWLCEYTRQFGKVCQDCCKFCPINWGVKTCMKKRSPYRTWMFNTFLDYEERAKLADIIAELPERKTHERIYQLEGSYRNRQGSIRK